MRSNEYIYGEGVEVPEVPAEVIMRRLEALDEHLDELMKVHYMDRDPHRIEAVLKAKDFWRRFLKEQD